MGEKKGAPWWIWFLMAIGLLTAVGRCSSDGDNISDNSASIQQPAVKSQTVELADTSKTSSVSSWQYSEEDDAMSSKKILMALIESRNVVTFDFPYTGEQRATLQLRKHPRFGNDVILYVQRGQFNMNYDGMTLLVRFDDGDAMRFNALEPEDHDRTAVFIKGYDRFVERMKKSSLVRIEATFYNEGNRVFEFDVSGFNNARL